MNHPDFRVRGKIFATLGFPSPEWGMVKLIPVQQSALVSSKGNTFSPCNGAWGAKGCTNVRVESATEAVLRAALQMAWENAASSSARHPGKVKKTVKSRAKPQARRITKPAKN